MISLQTLLLEAGLALDQLLDHGVVVVVLDIKMLLDEARREVVVDCVADDHHVVEVLGSVEFVVEQKITYDCTLPCFHR